MSGVKKLLLAYSLKKITLILKLRIGLQRCCESRIQKVIGYKCIYKRSLKTRLRNTTRVHVYVRGKVLPPSRYFGNFHAQGSELSECHFQFTTFQSSYRPILLLFAKTRFHINYCMHTRPELLILHE